MILGHFIVKVLRARLTQGCGAQVVMNILEHGMKAEAKKKACLSTNPWPLRLTWEMETKLEFTPFNLLTLGPKRRLEVSLPDASSLHQASPGTLYSVIIQ